MSFTEAQSDRGRALFETNCAGCHGATLQGGPAAPPIVGAAFRSRWQFQQGDALYAFMRAKMPPNAAGSLGDAGYADTMAYILKRNDARPSATPLPAVAAALAHLSLAEALPPLPVNEFKLLPPLVVVSMSVEVTGKTIMVLAGTEGSIAVTGRATVIVGKGGIPSGAAGSGGENALCWAGSGG